MEPNTQETKQPKLKPVEKELLIAEYEYIAQTAFQANEDRVKVYNYLLTVIIGLAATGIFSDFTDPNQQLLYTIIFLIIAIIGYISFLQVIKLREAWYESINALNHLKKHFYKDSPTLASAFKWKNNTLPKKSKICSVAFLIASTIAMLSSFSMGFAFFIATAGNLQTSLSTFIISIISQIILWFVLLKTKTK